MTTIEFFNNNELSDISKIRIYDDLNGQNAFFNGLDKKTVQGQYKGFTEPLLIYEGIEDAVKYSYGRFQIGSNWYYFFVTDVQQDTASKSWVYYRLDYWETTRYQFNASLGRGTLSRSSMVAPCATPYNSKFMVLKKHKYLGRGRETLLFYAACDVVFAARRSDDNKNYFGYIKGPFTNTEKNLLLSGEWISKIKYEQVQEAHFFAPGDVQGVWFTPSLIEGWTEYFQHGWEQAWVDGTGGPFDGKCLLSHGTPDTLFYRGISGTLITASEMNEYATDNTHTGVIKDLEGNIVFQLEYGRTYIRDIQAELVIGPTSAKWLCMGNSQEEPMNFETYFTLPCSTLDYFIDSEKEYYARERQFDIQTRELNSKKNLTSGVVNSGASGLSGAATGALVGASLGSIIPGPGTLIGAGVGALAGVLGGTITAGAQKGLDNVYNPQEQAIKDQYYHNALDTLAIVGSNLTQFLFSGSLEFKIAQYECDPDTLARIESDIAEYGQYTSWAVPSGESYLGNDARLKGDFIVLGSIPESWKGGIQQRISTGVHVIKH